MTNSTTQKKSTPASKKKNDTKSKSPSIYSSRKQSSMIPLWAKTAIAAALGVIIGGKFLDKSDLAVVDQDLLNAAREQMVNKDSKTNSKSDKKATSKEDIKDSKTSKRSTTLPNAPAINGIAYASDLAIAAYALQDLASEANSIQEGKEGEEGDDETETTQFKVKQAWDKLSDIEDHLSTWHMDPKHIPMGEQLLSTVSLVRGTMLRKFPKELKKELEALQKEVEEAENSTNTSSNSNFTTTTDEKIERFLNVETFEDPGYWDRHYNMTSGAKEWYLEGLYEDLAGDKIMFDEKSETGLFDDVHLKKFETLGSLLQHIGGKLSKPFKTLVLGSGNSDMSAQLVDDFPEIWTKDTIINLDVSSVVTQQMQEKRPDLKWLHGDARELREVLKKAEVFSPESDSFDLVLDKGTFDAVETDNELLEQILAETSAVMNKDNSILVSISIRKQPHVTGETNTKKPYY